MAGSENRFERAQRLSAAFDPIIDVCLRLGVNARELESLLRVQFVKRLADTLPKSAYSGPVPSNAQIALASGLDRQEVQRIRGGGTKKSAQQRMRKKSQAHSKSQRLIDTWRTDSRFLNNSGGPLALPISREFTDGPSFAELVSKAMPSRKWRLVLEDLRRRGVIQITDEIVRLRRVAPALPNELNAQALEALAQHMSGVGESILSGVENPAGDETSLALFATSEVSGVPPEQIPALRAAMEALVATFMQGVREEGRKKKGKRDKKAGVVIAASVYTIPGR